MRPKLNLMEKSQISKPNEYTDNFKSYLTCIFLSVRTKLKKPLCPRTLCTSPSLTYVVHVTELISFLLTGENGTKVMFQHLKIECFCWSFLTISCKKDTTKPKTKFLSVVKASAPFSFSSSFAKILAGHMHTSF